MFLVILVPRVRVLRCVILTLATKKTPTFKINILAVETAIITRLKKKKNSTKMSLNNLNKSKIQIQNSSKFFVT